VEGEERVRGHLSSGSKKSLTASGSLTQSHEVHTQDSVHTRQCAHTSSCCLRVPWNWQTQAQEGE
jgi:hypothetical protein